jgi:ribosomal protein L16
MPLMPKRVKYRKSQRGSRKGTASRNLKIDFGEFGLQTLERAWITNTQLEAARVALTRNMKRKGKLWIRIFPDKSVTSRPPEVFAAGGGQVAGAHKVSHTASCERRLSVMKMKEITELSTDELLTKRRDLRQERLHLRLQQQSGQLEQPSRLRLLRRDIARIQTELSQREKQTEAK